MNGRQRSRDRLAAARNARSRSRSSGRRAFRRGTSPRDLGTAFWSSNRETAVLAGAATTRTMTEYANDPRREDAICGAAGRTDIGARGPRSGTLGECPRLGCRLRSPSQPPLSFRIGWQSTLSSRRASSASRCRKIEFMQCAPLLAQDHHRRGSQRGRRTGSLVRRLSRAVQHTTILSPTEISPSVKMSALIPARWRRSLMIPGLVSSSRWRHGSQSATP
jgi:hypothetical protein